MQTASSLLKGLFRRAGPLPLMIVLVGCASAPIATSSAVSEPPAENHMEADLLKPTKLSSGDVAAVEAGTRRVLKDPDSARFGEMHAGISDKGVIWVCLLVNAKNSYGGYTGMKPFMGLLAREKHTFVPLPEDGRLPQYRDTAILTLCEQHGLRFGDRASPAGSAVAKP